MKPRLLAALAVLWLVLGHQPHAYAQFNLQHPLSAAGTNTFTGPNVFSKALASTALDQIVAVKNEAIGGSGVNGPPTSQQGLYIDVQKAGWYAATATAGQIEGLRITARQGGGTGTSAQADVSGITTNVQARDDNYGFTNAMENVVSLLHHATGQTDTIVRQVDTQVGVLNTPTTYYAGFVATSQIGTNSEGLRIQSLTGASWNTFIVGLLPSGSTGFSISGVDGSYTTPTGSVSALNGYLTNLYGPGGTSPAVTIAQSGATTWNHSMTVQGGVTDIGAFPSSTLTSSQSLVQGQCGDRLWVNSASAVSLSVPALQAGCEIHIIQQGAGGVTIVPGTTSTAILAPSLTSPSTSAAGAALRITVSPTNTTYRVSPE